MSKIIKFIPYSFEDGSDIKYVEIPISSKNFIPEWWKKQELFVEPYGIDDISFKACIPFLDSLNSGYMIYTNQDILVSIKNEKVHMEWTVAPSPLVAREESKNIPVPAGHKKDHFAWQISFGYELPKGYSVIITHPFNRFDLPFTTVSGIVDEGIPWGGKFSFWVKENFEGIIPKGTPIAQMIPFKTENWKSERSDYLIEYAKDLFHKKRTIRSGYYKKFIHKKKKFE